MRKLLLLLLPTLSFAATEVPKRNLFVPHPMREVSVLHKKGNFYVKEGTKEHEVCKADMDKPLRTMNKAELDRFMKNGYIEVNKNALGDYNLKAHGRLNGGGIAGATIGAYIGRGLVYGVCHGAILVVSICTGPAMPAVFSALESTLAPAIEVASWPASIAGGIIGGTVTGPV